MSVYLRELINAKEPLFSDGLRRLEKSTGHSGIDIRLIADLTEKRHQIINSLDLDGKDTTGQELYYSLLSLVEKNLHELLLDDCEYLLFKTNDGHIISFNKIDLIENYHHKLPYGYHIISNGQGQLKQELVNRYKSHKRTNDETVDEIVRIIGIID